MSEIWCNGDWLPSANYPGAAQDRGAFLGLGLFETMLGLDGVPLFTGRHLARLQRSGTKLGWSIEFPKLRETAAELLVRNRLGTGRSRIRLIVTSGSGALNDLAPGADRLVWLAAFPAGELPQSLSLNLAPWPRNERSPLAGMKTASYAENLVALDHARRLGFDETVILNTAGDVCETATANLFVVKNGSVLTPHPASGCLPGIGREVICEIASAHGIPCEERTVTLSELKAADEIFLSSATRGPVAVSRFEARDLAAGPVTAVLKTCWEAEIRRASQT
jgi:branched-chain amino acid aminotransferase